MNIREIERSLVHAQLRVMSTDDEALADATRYLTRALMGCFELAGKSSRASTKAPASTIDDLVLRAMNAESA